MRFRPANPTRTVLAATTAIAFVVVALSGCLTDRAEASSVALYVKDDVTEHYSEVHVTYTRVEALPENGQEWVVAFEGNTTIELLSLSDSTAKEKLGDLSLEPGTYEGLRIAIANVQAIDHNGTAHNLTVIGDLLQIADSFTVTADGELAILVDFDLAGSIDADAGTFQAEAASVQRNDRDSDADGLDDIDDADDDNDGVEDRHDEDIDGDNRTDRPEQSRHGYFGLCTAWVASETGRMHGNASAENPAFVRLQEEASNATQSVEEFCDAQPFPGRPDAMPDHARQAREDALKARQEACERAEEARQGHGPPSDRPGGGNETSPSPGQDDDEPADGRGRSDGPPGCVEPVA